MPYPGTLHSENKGMMIKKILTALIVAGKGSIKAIVEFLWHKKQVAGVRLSLH